jgi:GNAT superfamily N-acetyltransferase
VIRPFEPEDGEAVATLLEKDVVPHSHSAEGVRDSLTGQPERAPARAWVAVASEDVVGWSEARLEWTTSAHDVASVWIFVGPNHRRRSLGAELYEAARAHLASLGARARVLGERRGRESLSRRQAIRARPRPAGAQPGAEHGGSVRLRHAASCQEG